MALSPQPSWDYFELAATAETEDFGFFWITHHRTKQFAHRLVYHQHLIIWTGISESKSHDIRMQYKSGNVQGVTGPLLFLPAGVELQTIAPTSVHAGEAIVCSFDAKFMPDAPVPGKMSAYDVRRCIELDNSWISSLFQKVSMELRRPVSATDPVYRCLTELMAIEIHRQLRSRERADRIRVTNGALSPRSISLIEAYIDSIGDRVPGIAEISEHFGLTPSYLAQAFLRTTGRALKEHLCNCRISRAQHLLDHSDESVETVARQVGFSDASAFSRAFARSVGLRPGAYRRASCAGSARLLAIQ